MFCCGLNRKVGAIVEFYNIFLDSPFNFTYLWSFVETFWNYILQRRTQKTQHFWIAVAQPLVNENLKIGKI
jgi:hypothetical protein